MERGWVGGSAPFAVGLEVDVQFVLLSNARQPVQVVEILLVARLPHRIRHRSLPHLPSR